MTRIIQKNKSTVMGTGVPDARSASISASRSSMDLSASRFTPTATLHFGDWNHPCSGRPESGLFLLPYLLSQPHVANVHLGVQHFEKPLNSPQHQMQLSYAYIRHCVEFLVQPFLNHMQDTGVSLEKLSPRILHPRETEMETLKIPLDARVLSCNFQFTCFPGLRWSGLTLSLSLWRSSKAWIRFFHVSNQITWSSIWILHNVHLEWVA